MDSREQVHMRRYQADLEHVRSMMARGTTKVATQELCAGGIKQWSSVTGGPCQMEIEPMVHSPRWREIPVD
jgi:hypothetical protein